MKVSVVIGEYVLSSVCIYGVPADAAVSSIAYWAAKRKGFGQFSCGNGFFLFWWGRAEEEARTRRGLPLAVPVDLAATVSGGAACPLCRLLPLPLACFIAPIPPTRARRALFPAGRGRPRLFHARGFAPCIPSIRPPAALTEPAKQVPCGGLAPGVVGSAGVNGTHGWRGGWDAALMNSAGSQGEGGPGEMELSVARDGGV